MGGSAMKHEPIIESCDRRQGVRIVEYNTIRVTSNHEQGVTRYEIEAPSAGASPAYGGVYLISRGEAEQIIEGLTRLLD